jgi:mannose-6-phosphate isomerase-like protein (cupin superfamily)
MRRIVTGEVGGKSRIIEDGPASVTPFWDDLWTADPDQPLGYEPKVDTFSLEPPSGGTGWRVYAVPPDAEMHKILEENEEDNEVSDAKGYHKTNTLDYVYVLDGDITLELEEGAVKLEPGDCVVQRGTNHAWRNHHEHPVRLLTVMVSLPPVQ